MTQSVTFVQGQQKITVKCPLDKYASFDVPDLNAFTAKNLISKILLSSLQTQICSSKLTIHVHLMVFSVSLSLSLSPQLADRNLLQNAEKQSEDCHLEQQMLEDKLRETDWEVTQETIEEQVARESYLQWLRDNEKRAKRQASVSIPNPIPGS